MISMPNILIALTAMCKYPSFIPWREIKDIGEDANGNVIRFSVRNIRGVAEGEPAGPWLRITPGIVQAIVPDIWVGKIDLDREAISQFVGSKWDLDSVGACQLLQILYFGEVKYG